MNPPSIISYGGGVQSTALTVLAGLGELPYRHAVFANVGEDSENPATLDYVQNVMVPWAADRGVEVHEIRKEPTHGMTKDTVLSHALDMDSKSIIIPVRMKNGAPGNRRCTTLFKIRVVDKWLAQRGANKENQAEVAIGFSTDEWKRANRRQKSAFSTPAYPLLDLGMSRTDCARLIEDQGLPVPPKSACFFCPYHRKQQWIDMRENEPELFQRAVEVEVEINKKREALGKDPAFLTHYAVPLDEAIERVAPDPLPLFEDTCDDGFCWT